MTPNEGSAQNNTEINKHNEEERRMEGRKDANWWNRQGTDRNWIDSGGFTSLPSLSLSV